MKQSLYQISTGEGYIIYPQIHAVNPEEALIKTIREYGYKPFLDVLITMHKFNEKKDKWEWVS